MKKYNTIILKHTCIMGKKIRLYILQAEIHSSTINSKVNEVRLIIFSPKRRESFILKYELIHIAIGCICKVNHIE